MQFVFFLQAAQDRDCVLDIGLVDKDRLEAPRQRRVLFDIFPVLVERRRADAVKVAARQRGLQQVRGIHRAVGLAGADKLVHLVDEENDTAVRRADFAEHGLQPLLEFAAIFGAGDQRAEIERHQLLALQAFGHVAIDDAERETLGNRRLADAGLADQHRIVLGAARQHLDGAPDFLVAADHRVELARACFGGEVARIFLQRVIGVFRAGAVGGAALAHGFDGAIERLRRDAGGLENFFGFGTGRQRDRQQEALGGDETVAGFLRKLLGLLEETRRLGRKIKLAGACALDLRHFRQRRFDAGQRLIGPPAGRADETGGEAFLVVEQNLQHMFGCETLMARPECEPLRGLDEAAAPVRIFFEIHVSSLSSTRRKPPAALSVFRSGPA